jgi:hypothetical protein
MKEKCEDSLNNFAAILLGLLAIMALRSIFSNDSSKIISDKGKKLLGDKDEMKKINGKIDNLETSKGDKEIII